MYNTIKPLPITPCCIAKTLPLAFDESLSYLEQLCSILSKLNDVITQTNSNTDFINNWNSNLTEIEERLTNLENEFNNLEDSVYKYIDDKFLQAYNELLTLFNEQVQMIKDQLNADLIIFKQYVDDADSNLQKQIDDIIAGKIVIYNPTNGKTEGIEKVINDIYGVLRYNALTCTEFDVSGITAQEFDDLELTAFEFDTNGKNYIGIANKYLNLATGTYEPLQDILNTLFSYHQNGITATAFDELELTCDDYDSKKITAYEFDFNNPLVV